MTGQLVGEGFGGAMQAYLREERFAVEDGLGNAPKSDPGDDATIFVPKRVCQGRIVRRSERSCVSSAKARLADSPDIPWKADPRQCARFGKARDHAQESVGAPRRSSTMSSHVLAVATMYS